MPLARGTRTGARVWPELASFFMLSLLGVHKSYGTASVGVFTGEHNIAGDFLHGEVAYVAERAAARRAAGQLGAAARAHQVPALALQDRRQHIVEAHGTLEQRGEVGGHGVRRVHQCGHPGDRTTGTASSAPLVVCAHVTVTRT